MSAPRPRLANATSDYAFSRLKNSSEWALSDIDNILKATGYTVKELFADQFDLKMLTDLEGRDDARATASSPSTSKARASRHWTPTPRCS